MECMKAWKGSDVELRYVDNEGSGPLVFFFHGFGGSINDWRSTYSIMNSRARVILVNLRPLFLKPWLFSKHVEVLSQFVNTVNKARSPFHLVGVSYGGTLTYAIRAHFQSLVASHTMINPMPLNPLKALKDHPLRWVLHPRIPAKLLAYLLKSQGGLFLIQNLADTLRLGPKKKPLGEMNDKKLAIIVGAIQRFAWICKNEDWKFWRDLHKGSFVPSMIIYSSNDPLFPASSYMEYTRLLPWTETKQLASASHLPMQNHADEIESLLISWLEQHGKKQQESFKLPEVS